MEKNLPLLLAESERMEPENRKARSAAFRSLAMKWWRQEQRPKLQRANAGVLGIDRGPTREEIVAAMAKGIR